MSIEQRTVAEIALIWPEVVPVLERHGIDSCCGGSHVLRTAVEAHGLELEEVVSELRDAGAVDDDGPVVVDVRAMVPRDRHPLIFSTFDRLVAGESMTLINDHDPKPLYYQLQAERPGQMAWEPQEEGPERWVIRIGKVAAQA